MRLLVAMEQDLGVVNAGEDEDEDASDEADGEHGFEKINENCDCEVHSRKRLGLQLLLEMNGSKDRLREI